MMRSKDELLTSTSCEDKRNDEKKWERFVAVKMGQGQPPSSLQDIITRATTQSLARKLEDSHLYFFPIEPPLRASKRGCPSRSS